MPANSVEADLQRPPQPTYDFDGIPSHLLPLTPQVVQSSIEGDFA